MNENELRQIREISDLLYKSHHAVFFGGAGVSTDSGIPDFRGSSGLYKDVTNEYLLSRTCLEKEPSRFFDFYRSKMVYPDAKPNITHNALARLEEKGIIKAVITQNIDGLHSLAGSRNVLELHGTTKRCYCMRCKREYDGEYISKGASVPLCEACSGVVRPDVVLYGECLDTALLYRAEEHIEKADVLIVGGTSLNVFPAAGFVAEFIGAHLIIVNLSPTQFDGNAQYVIRQPIGDFFRLITDFDNK